MAKAAYWLTRSPGRRRNFRLREPGLAAERGGRFGILLDDSGTVDVHDGDRLRLRGARTLRCPAAPLT